MMKCIVLKNIYKKYYKNTAAEVIALKGINLDITKGEIVSIIGPSGSGKSTLLHILGCLDNVDSGNYFLGDEDIIKKSNSELALIRNRKIGFVLQEFGLINNQTVLENVSIPLLFSKTRFFDIKKIVLDNLQEIGISDLVYRKISELSGGQKQRVAIARALVNNPEIILADEPTGALDQKTSELIINTLLDLNKQGKTVVIVTHNMKIAEKCNRSIRINDGIIEDS